MIGAGAVGAGTAWHLARQGHNVTLIDPSLDAPIQRSNGHDQALNGTAASLGVLMGNVFRRSSGRAWRLRQRSMELWPQWVEKLNHPDTPLQLDTPLIQLASSPLESERMQSLAKQRRELGLESFSSESTEALQTSDQIPWPNPGHGGLRSQNDGRIDPLALQRALRRSLKAEKVALLPARVTTLHRPNPGDGNRWRLDLRHRPQHPLRRCCDLHSLSQCTVVATSRARVPDGSSPRPGPRPSSVGHHQGLGSLASSAGLQRNQSDSSWRQQALAWRNPRTR